jgi:hypothetical protein
VRGQSPEEVGSHEPIMNPSADPAENKTDVRGRFLILREKLMEMKRRILFQE